MAIKFREIVRLIEEDVGIKFGNEAATANLSTILKTGLLTISYQSLTDAVPAGTLNSIY